MAHKVLPYEKQLHVAYSENGPEPTAIELRFPLTFSGQAQRVLRFRDGEIFLFSWGGKFVATDQSMKLTRDFPADASPYWTGDSLEDLEAYLESVADLWDRLPAEQLPGWAETRPFTAPETEFRGTGASPDRLPGDLEKAVMVVMDRRNGCICFRTTDRDRGRQVCLSLDEDELEPLLRNVSRRVVSTDGINFIELIRSRQEALICFTWLKHDSFHGVSGFWQEVAVPLKLMRDAFGERKRLRYLYVPPVRRARVKFDRSPGTRDTIHRVVYGDRKIRRAFMRALRDLFRWPGEEVTLFGDGEYDFRFRSRSGCYHNGRLVLTERKDGDPSKFSYMLNS